MRRFIPILAAAAIGASALMAAPAFAEPRSPQHLIAPLDDSAEERQAWWALTWAMRNWHAWEAPASWETMYKLHLLRDLARHQDEDSEDDG